MTDDNDPVIESYDVFMVNSKTLDPILDRDTSDSSRLFVLQYPAHRSSSRPYSSARSQQPTTLRLKPETGMIEVDVPIITKEYYDIAQGAKFGKALTENHTIRSGAALGLAGGFGAGQNSSSMIQNNTSSSETHYVEPTLSTQTLGGKSTIPTERDPIYMLGRLHGSELHLSQLHAVVQMRPQLHHIDAEDENNQKRVQSSIYGQANKPKPGSETGPGRIESKAIEIKIKDNKDDARDRNLNTNARMLRDIQAEQWQEHVWIEQASDMGKPRYSTTDLPTDVKLKSSINNNDWLDRMSAPREDGKKGLLAKLRGRERERARRKKAEEEKRTKLAQQQTASAARPGHSLDMSSDSNEEDVSDSESSQNSEDANPQDVQDVDMDDRDVSEADIKEEPVASASTSGPTIAPSEASQPMQPQPKKRGRPRKDT